MKLFVSNIYYGMTEGEVKVLFSAYGKVHDIHMLYERPSREFRGMAFIVMDDEAGMKAIEELNEKIVEGRKLYVNKAREVLVKSKEET